MGPFARRSRFPKTLRGKAVVNLCDFGQPWIPTGRTIWIADAHRDDGKRFVVRADEKLTAFTGLESQLLAKGIMSRKRRVSRS